MKIKVYEWNPSNERTGAYVDIEIADDMPLTDALLAAFWQHYSGGFITENNASIIQIDSTMNAVAWRFDKVQMRKVRTQHVAFKAAIQTLLAEMNKDPVVELKYTVVQLDMGGDGDEDDYRDFVFFGEVSTETAVRYLVEVEFAGDPIVSEPLAYDGMTPAQRVENLIVHSSVIDRIIVPNLRPLDGEAKN